MRVSAKIRPLIPMSNKPKDVRGQLPSALATDQRQLGEHERQPTHRQSVPRDNLELTSQHDRRLPSRRCQSRRCRTRISRRTSRKKLTPIRNVLLQVQVHLIRRRKLFGASSSVAKMDPCPPCRVRGSVDRSPRRIEAIESLLQHTHGRRAPPIERRVYFRFS